MKEENKKNAGVVVKRRNVFADRCLRSFHAQPHNTVSAKCKRKKKEKRARVVLRTEIRIRTPKDKSKA